MEGISNNSNKETPKIFQMFGKIVEHSSWLGYIFAFGLILFWGVGLAFNYEYFRLGDLLKGLVSLGFILFLSFGYVKFAMFYGLALQKGRRSAVIGLILILTFITCLLGLNLVINPSISLEPIVFWTVFVLFVISASCIVLLTVALTIYWGKLKGGMRIY